MVGDVEMGTVIENQEMVRRGLSEGGSDPPSNDSPASHVEVPVDPAQDAVNRDLRHKVWQLVPFFRRVFIYFVVTGLADNNRLDLPSWGRVIFKCLPVFTLSIFIYRQFDSLLLLWRNKYSLLLFIGMIFSFIADGLLVFQNNHFGFFLAGLIFFAIAHGLYTFAFGWRPLESRMLVRSLIAAGIVYYYLYSGNLRTSGIGLIVGVAIYVVVIFAMQWRAWAITSYSDITEGRYYKLSGALGASFFALSDAILGVNKFNFPVPAEAFLILFFYYLGQMLIALSVVDQIPHRSPQVSAKDLTEVGGPSSSHAPPRSVASKFKQVIAKIVNWIVS